MYGLPPVAGEVPQPVAVPGRVLVVDDHELVRVGLRSAFAELDGVPIEWLEAANLADAISTYQAAGPVDVVLLDMNLADCKGLQGLRQFLATCPQARVIMFSGTHDEFVVRQARALGAVGYVGKGALMADMREALRCALQLPASSAGGRLAKGPRPPLFPQVPSSAVYDRVAELGTRHLEILELVLSGCTNQEISNATSLSLGTVKNYVSSLLLALDVRSRSHLISLFR
jgi:DNA-binding NarL/FixJ family response regulator